jgi:hypothetical protein
MAQPTNESAIKRIVRTPQYKMQVVRDKTKFYRKDKHKKKPVNDWLYYWLVSCYLSNAIVKEALTTIPMLGSK